MDSVQRTIFSAHLQTCKSLKRPFTILPNSTLNQKFNLFASEVPSVGEYPVLGYIGIGNKGATYDVTGAGFVLTTPIPHLPRHASLYNFIPFVIRDITNDKRNKVIQASMTRQMRNRCCQHKTSSCDIICCAFITNTDIT